MTNMLTFQVVAVDAMLSSLKLLQKSLLLNDLSCAVTLVHNALHRSHKKMKIHHNPTNIGGSQVLDINAEELSVPR